jgi:hypothetical protein
MMGVDHLIADLVDRRRAVDLEVLDELVFQHYVADGVPSCVGRGPRRRHAVVVFRFADTYPRG